MTVLPRSLLFVPATRPELVAKAVASGADAVILDLEDSVVDDQKPVAREHVVRLVRQGAAVPLLVRVNPLDGPHIADDLSALTEVRPHALMLPKSLSARSVSALSARLTGALAGTPVLPIATEAPAAVFELASYAEVISDLAGLTWGAEDLPAAIGAETGWEAGELTTPYQMVRALTLFGAHAAGVQAIETVFPALADQGGLERFARRAARDGFSGMLALHPAQVPVINAAFTPSEDAVRRARAIIAAFQGHAGRGALKVDGKMVDAPHLKQAEALLRRVETKGS